jgi:predicted metal-dependent hydrolase
MIKPIREKSTHEILLKKGKIPYTLIKTNRAKHLSLKINHINGLEVVVPCRYPISRIPRFIHEKEDWILKHLSQIQRKTKFHDGTIIKVLGAPKTIRILPTRKSRTYIKEARALKFAENIAYYDQEEILIYTPKNSIMQAKQTLEKHLRKQANLFFQKRTAILATQMNLQYNRITIRGQKSRWGSCSKNKNLNFNWRLILTSPEIIDAIIIHELAHLKHLNHGPKFYALVEKYCPTYKKQNKELKNWEFLV